MAGATVVWVVLLNSYGPNVTVLSLHDSRPVPVRAVPKN